MSDPVLIEREATLTVLQLNRPAKRNAMNDDAWNALRRLAIQLADPAPRAVVLIGAGDHFCAGMDLSHENPIYKRLEPLIQRKDAFRLQEEIGNLQNAIGALTQVPAPILAAIEGSCLGAGVEIALAADLRVAAEDATFALPETRFGMVPDLGGMVRLSRLIGRGPTTDLVLTGRTIDAQTALSLGLVDRVVPRGQALTAARALVDEIALASPAATRQALMVLRMLAGKDDERDFALERAGGARALMSGDVREGLAAFATRQPPLWKR